MDRAPPGSAARQHNGAAPESASTMRPGPARRQARRPGRYRTVPCAARGALDIGLPRV